MVDIYNQRFDNPVQPNSNTATLFSVDFDNRDLTLLQITTGLRDIVQGGNQKQIAIYLSNSTVSTGNSDRSQTLYRKVLGLLLFIQSYDNLSTSFILRGSLGWEFLPILLQKSQVYLTNGTIFSFHSQQLGNVVYCLKDDVKILHNLVENVSSKPVYTAIYNTSDLTQLGFDIFQYN